MRDLRIDFLRGLALLMIAIDHAPSNFLNLFTLASWSFADAAELFFFLSGFVAALVYGRSLQKLGLKAAAVRIWRRARTLYFTQLALLLALTLAVLAYSQFDAQTSAAENLRLAHFLAHPAAAMAQAMALIYQPAYLDILPVYIVFFIALPLVLLLLQRQVWLTLGLSFALYLGVQIYGWTLLTMPEGKSWYFDPLAWQFVFVTGAAFGSGRMSPLLPVLKTRLVTIAAALVAGATALIVASDSWHQVINGIPSLWQFDLPADKTTLASLRLVSFLALALVVWRVLPASETLERLPFSRAVIRCGQHSLTIFSAGIVLAAMQAMMMAGWQNPWAITAGAGFGVAGLMLLADQLSRRALPGLPVSDPVRAGAGS